MRKILFWTIVILGGIFLPIYVGNAHNSESLDQTNFWFRDDDGSESTATGFGSPDTAADTNITDVATDAQLRLRITIDDTTAAQTNNQEYEMQFSSDATTCTNGTWTTLTNASAEWQIFASANITDQEATTEQLTNQGTFVAGSIQDVSQLTTKISFSDGTDQFTEVEYTVGGNSPAGSTTYRFRMVKSGGTALQAYSACPQLTTAAATISVNVLDGTVAYGTVALGAQSDTVGVTNPTLHTANGTTTSASAHTTATFTPTANALLIVWQAGGDVEDTMTTTQAPTDNFGDTGGGSWTEVRDTAKANQFDASFWYRNIGSSPSAGEVTLNFDAATERTSWIVFEVSGHDTSSPIAESADTVDTLDPYTVGTLANAASGNLIVAGGLSREATSLGADADFTELSETTSGDTNQARISVQYDPNDDEVAATFDPDATEQNIGHIFEIAAASAADTQDAVNDGTTTEDFNIKGQNGSGGGCTWTLASSAGSDQYVHEFSTNGGTDWVALSTSYQPLATGIAQNATQSFDLRVTLPTTSSCSGQQNVNVDVQAVQG